MQVTAFFPMLAVFVLFCENSAEKKIWLKSVKNTKEKVSNITENRIEKHARTLNVQEKEKENSSVFKNCPRSYWSIHHRSKSTSTDLRLPFKREIIKRNLDAFSRKKTYRRALEETPALITRKPNSSLTNTPATRSFHDGKPEDGYRLCSRDKTCEQRCTNTTEWRTEKKFTCFCDPDCYEVFNDCCSDYVTFCGVQKPKNNLKNKFTWKCVNSGTQKLDEDESSYGVWMVNQCAPDWPHNNIRKSCENASITRGIYQTIPILNRENITFRNVYCALCNHANPKDDFWSFGVDTDVLLPTHFNLTQQVRFYISHNAEFRYWPKQHQPSRFCVEKVIDTCHDKNQSCINGRVEIIFAPQLGQYLINKKCATCQKFFGAITRFKCFPASNIDQIRPGPRPLSLVFNFRCFGAEQGTLRIGKERCNNGLLFDEILQVCTVNWVLPLPNAGPEKYYVISWLQSIREIDSLSNEIVRKSFVTYLQLLPENFNVSEIKRVVDFFIAKSTIILTREQSVGLRSEKFHLNLTRSKISNFIHFRKSWSMEILNRTFTVFKTTSRPLKCFGRMTYTSRKYTMLNDGSIFINATNTTYEKTKYFREKTEGRSDLFGKISLCEKYIPVSCNFAWKLLSPGQFKILENLSVYENNTSTALYHYGQYEIVSNNSVMVCISNERTTKQNWMKENDMVLGWITISCLSLSILSLVILLITYIIFSELRTLPGKNLMHLAFTLLMSSVSWIISSFTQPEQHPRFCIALIMVQHYFLIASFTGTNVIAFHMWKTFSKELSAPRTSRKHERNLFTIYVLSVWFFSATLVGTCFILERKNLINVGYGDSDICWFRHKLGFIYFTILPNAMSLLFNIFTFLITALHLRKHSENIAARQCQGSVKRSYLVIYLKLSSLMGFTWLFGLLDVAVNVSRIFEYLFVICTCLQGVFISMAFVFKKEVLKMYKEKMVRGLRGENPGSSVNLSRNASMETIL